MTEIPLVVGSGTAPERWRPEQAPSLERVEAWSARGPDAPADWIAEIEFPRQPIAALEIVNTSPNAVLNVRSLNLIDDGRQMAFPITPDSRVERLDFFDVKLYDRQDALPRAHLVERARVLDDAEAAARLADPAFDPRLEVVLAPSATAANLGGLAPGTAATFEDDGAERVRIAVRAPCRRATWCSRIAGTPAGSRRSTASRRRSSGRTSCSGRCGCRPGDHLVEFRYEPRSVRTGALVSAGSIVATVALFVGLHLWSRRRRRGSSTVSDPVSGPVDEAALPGEMPDDEAAGAPPSDDDLLGHVVAILFAADEPLDRRRACATAGGPPDARQPDRADGWRRARRPGCCCNATTTGSSL